jgi:hypothetical protein
MAPPMLGMGKLRMLKGDTVLVHRPIKEDKGGGGNNGGKDDDNTNSKPPGLVFELLNPDDQVRAAVQKLEPAFNVLYVETPRIAALQSPQWRAFADTWREAMAMLGGAARLGLPRTSVADKSPYLDEALWSKPEGRVLLSDRMRRAVSARAGTAFGSKEEQADAARRRRAEGGGGQRAPLAALERAQSFQEAKLPHPRFYLSEPSPSVVIALNLAAYWIITRGNLKKAG